MIISSRFRYYICLGLVLAALVVYLPAITGGFIWDDDEYVTENRLLRSGEGLRKIWFEPGATVQYYPMVFSTFWAEYQLWQLNPFWYHLVNVLIHAYNALLIWIVLKNLRVAGALMAALIFAFHPVHVETAAWITEHKNTFSGFFYMLSLIAYIRFAGLDNINKNTLTVNQGYPEQIHPGRWRFYALSFLLFVLAVLYKSVTSTLPAAILLLIWWKRGRVRIKDVFLLLPYFLVSAAFAVISVNMERIRVGATGEPWSLSFVERVLVAGRALWFYIYKLVIPVNLTFMYPRWEIDDRVWWQYLYPLMVIIVFILLWRFRHRIGRGPLAAVLFYIGTLTPALGFFNVYPHKYSYVADHFQYLASMGMIALIVAIVAKRLPEHVSRNKTAMVIIGLLISGVLGILSWNQAHIYRNIETLYTDTLAKNPECWMAHVNLGAYLVNRGRVDEAIDHYHKGILLKPDDEKAYYNLGIAESKKGRTEKAIECYLHAIDLKPDYADAHYNLAIQLNNAGRTTEAINHYRTVLKIKPGYADAHYNLAILLGDQGYTDQAISHYLQTLKLNPDYADAHYNLAILLGKQDKREDAMHHYRETLRINPDYAKAYCNMGVLMDNNGRTDEAKTCYMKALSLKPDFVLVLFNLGLVYYREGNTETAKNYFRQVIELDPGHERARYFIDKISRE